MKKSNPWIDEIPHLSLLVPPLPDFHTGSEGRSELAGLVEEEGLDIMRPLGIFLENCRSLSAWKIWAIWIKRVKLSVGRDEAAGAAGQLGLARGAVESTEQCSEPLAEGSTLPFPSLATQSISIVLLLVHLPPQGASRGVEAARGQRLALGRGRLVTQRIRC